MLNAFNAVKKYASNITFLLGDFKRQLPVIFILFFISSFLDVVGIAVVANLFSAFTAPNPDGFPMDWLVRFFYDDPDLKSLVIVAGLFFFTLYFVKFLSVLFIHYVVLNFCAKVSIDLRHKLFEAFMNIPFAGYSSKDSGEYIDIMQRRVALFSQTALFNLIRSISEIVMISSILVTISISFPLGTLVLTLIGGLLVTVYFLLIGSNANRLGKEANKYSAILMQLLKEGLSGKKEIFVYGKTSQFSNEIKKSAEHFAKANRNAIFINTSPKIVIEFLIAVGLILAAVIIVQFPEQHNYTLPFFSALSVAGLRIIPGTHVLMSGLLNLQHTRSSVENLVEEIKQLEISNKKAAKANLIPMNPFETLELKSVSFAHEGQRNSALTGIDLIIKKGSLITIIGASGSGKSTLLDVILGLTKPSHGQVLVNGTNIERLGGNWTEAIAFCPQQPFIFKENLDRNITLDFKEAEKHRSSLIRNARLQDAVKNAGLDTATLERLKYSRNKITDGGGNISGGQMQRIGLARSLYSGRKFLVLDEPTSALDLVTEKKVLDRLKLLTQDKTIIIASHSQLAHDLSDQVYSLSDGRIQRIK